jgi:hypothetical protein
MDVELAVSFSESFCIVAADAVSCGVPLVCSDQIPWACSFSIVDTTDTESIIRGLRRVLGPFKNWFLHRNQGNLASYSKAAEEIWLKHFAG